MPELLDLPALVSWLDSTQLDVQIEGVWSGVFGYMLAADEAAAWSRLINEEMLRRASGDTVDCWRSRPFQSKMECAQSRARGGSEDGLHGSDSRDARTQ